MKQHNTDLDTSSEASAAPVGGSGGARHSWTFLSNHAHVLICLAQDPDLRLKDVAARIGVTERAVQGIVKDLEDEGLLRRQKDGRRNHYELSLDQPLRHPVEAHRSVRELVELCSKDRATEGEAGETIR